MKIPLVPVILPGFREDPNQPHDERRDVHESGAGPTAAEDIDRVAGGVENQLDKVYITRSRV
jgi:hypothetical protein